MNLWYSNISVCQLNISVVKKQNEILTEIISKEWKYDFIEDNEVLKKYECPICLDIFTDPMVHSLCGNLFCRHCIKKVSNCLKCGKQVLPSNIIPEPNLIKEVLELIELIIKKQSEIINEIISKRWLYEFHEVKETLKKYKCSITVSRSWSYGRCTNAWDILIDPISHSIDGNLFCIDFDNHPGICSAKSALVKLICVLYVETDNTNWYYSSTKLI